MTPIVSLLPYLGHPKQGLVSPSLSPSFPPSLHSFHHRAEDFAAPWIMAQVLEANGGEIPAHLAHYFSEENLMAVRAEKRAEREERREAQIAAGEEVGEEEEEESEEYDSESEEEEEEGEKEGGGVVVGGSALFGGEDGGGRRRRRRAAAPASSSSSSSSSASAAAAAALRAAAGTGGGGGGLLGEVGHLTGEGKAQTVVVQPHGGGVKWVAGLKDMVGLSVNKKSLCVQAFNHNMKHFLRGNVEDIRKGAVLYDSVARLVVGVTATVNYTVDQRHHLSPKSGIYLGKMRVWQGGPGSNHNIPPSDQALIKKGIFTLEQLVHHECTGEVMPWCDTAEGKLLLKDKEAKQLLEALLKKYGREGAAYGTMGMGAGSSSSSSSCSSSSSSSSSSSEEEEEEEEEEKEGEEGGMMAAAAAVAAQVGGEEEEEDEDEWEEEGEGGAGGSGSDSSGEWETYHVPFSALPPPAASLLSSAGGGGGLAVSPSLAPPHHYHHHHQQQLLQQGADDDAGSESSWEPLRR
jgi:hypothetical protein